MFSVINLIDIKIIDIILLIIYNTKRYFKIYLLYVCLA